MAGCLCRKTLQPAWAPVATRVADAQRGPGMSARLAHRGLALALAGFLLAHLAHHLWGALAGPQAHEALRLALGVVYRHPLVEPLLLAGFMMQAILGLVLARRRGWRGMQAISGLVLAAFLPVHLGAILMARAQGVTTDLGFAAAGVQDWPWTLFFAPYYALAVWALLAHAGAGMARACPTRAALFRAGGHVAGLGLALAILGLLSGLLHGFNAPPFVLMPP